jgi:hypothetical protein
MRDLYVPASIGTQGGEGWVSAGEIVGDAGAFVREQLRGARARPGFVKRDAAMSLVGDIPWWVWGAAILLYATERRVPDLSPRNVLLRYEAGYLEEAAFASGDFAALARDPEAASAARVFADEGTMRDWMRACLERLLSPLVPEVRAVTRVGERTLWGRASDLVAQRFLWTGELCGDWPWCGREAEAFVKAPGSPLNRNNAFFDVEHAGRRGVFMRRSVCCQEYRSPGGDQCEQCPMLPQAERVRRAREVLSGERGEERWA